MRALIAPISEAAKKSDRRVELAGRVAWKGLSAGRRRFHDRLALIWGCRLRRNSGPSEFEHPPKGDGDRCDWDHLQGAEVRREQDPPPSASGTTIGYRSR